MDKCHLKCKKGGGETTNGGTHPEQIQVEYQWKARGQPTETGEAPSSEGAINDMEFDNEAEVGGQFAPSSSLFVARSILHLCILALGQIWMMVRLPECVGVSRNGNCIV